jgi:hypothetical protein
VESTGAKDMKRTDVPPEIFNALSAMVADRYCLGELAAEDWVKDVLKKGNKSIYWANVYEVSLEFFKPIIDALMPMVKQAISYAANAAMFKAEEINRHDHTNHPEL